MNLVRKQGLSQLRAAEIIGVSQPAISHYLGSQIKIRDELKGSLEDIDSTVAAISERLATGKLEQDDAFKSICALCLHMRNEGPICRIHRRELSSTRIEACSVCSVDLTSIRRISSEDGGILRSLKVAADLLEQTRDVAFLIPEIGMNIAYAKPEASNTLEVAGIPGRMRPITGRPKAANPPEFGGSDHVARAILALMKFNSSRRSAVNLRYEEGIVKICRRVGLDISFFDRSLEPFEVKKVDGRTIAWGVEQAVARIGRAPDVIYDIGEEGKEPMIFVFGATPIEVAELACGIAHEYVKTKHEL